MLFLPQEHKSIKSLQDDTVWVTKGAECRTLIGCIVNIRHVFAMQLWEEIISGKPDLRRTCFLCPLLSFLLSYFHIMPHNVTTPLHQPAPVQSLLSLDVWYDSQSAALCTVGRTYCSVLNHKSSLDRLCTLNRHVSHITSQGCMGC